jgi:hypothetical protein
MLDIPGMSWEEIRTDIHPEVFTTRIDPDDKWIPETKYPSDTFYLLLGSLHIVYIIELVYSDGTYQRQAVSHADLLRWGIDGDALRTFAADEYSRFPPSPWKRASCMGIVYEPPDFTKLWTHDLLNPDFPATLKLKGRPLLTVPRTDYFIITGDRDLCGRRSQKRLTRDTAPGGIPLIARSLVFDGGTWQEH